MRRIFLFILSTFLLVACTKKDNAQHSGTLAGTEWQSIHMDQPAILIFNTSNTAIMRSPSGFSNMSYSYNASTGMGMLSGEKVNNARFELSGDHLKIYMDHVPQVYTRVK